MCKITKFNIYIFIFYSQNGICTFCRTCFHIRRHAKQQHQAGHTTAPTLPTLPSTYSVHDFHNNYQGTGHYPGMHFHLAASINAETGTIIKFNTSVNYNEEILNVYTCKHS